MVQGCPWDHIYKKMLMSFDTKFYEMDNNFCMELRGPGALQVRRSCALEVLSWELWRVYQKPVVVLIDKYDLPMHSAIEHGYAALLRSFILLYCSYLMLFQANDFFATVFGSLLMFVNANV
jgi:hypothetical protein